MTDMVQTKVANTRTEEAMIIKSDRGSARVNKEGILEIEERFEEEDLSKPVPKKREVKGIEYVGDPFSSAKSPADLANIAIRMQEQQAQSAANDKSTSNKQVVNLLDTPIVETQPKSILKKPTSTPAKPIIHEQV